MKINEWLFGRLYSRFDIAVMIVYGLLMFNEMYITAILVIIGGAIASLLLEQKFLGPVRRRPRE